MIVHSYNIKWGYKTLRNGIFTVKFDIIFQSNSLSIEKYCKQNYPRMLDRNTAFSMEELQRLYKMRLYIKKAVSRELSEVTDFFYSKNWFGDIPKDKKYFSLEFTDFDCKNVNGLLPHLSMEGVITFNVREMFNLYIANNYIQIVDKDNMFIKEVIDLIIMKSFPMLLSFESFFMIKDEILGIIKSMCNKPSRLLSMVEKKLKISNLHTFKKDVTWINDNIFRITINDYVKLAGVKIKQNAVPLTLVGLWAYNKQKKKRVKEALNIFDKMVGVAQEIVERNERER